MTDGRIDSNRFQRGFTLAEILVTTAIFAIIMIAALAVYDKSNQVFKQSTEAADLQQSTRIGFDKLVADLRMAGFDYSRGGIPGGEGQFPQPDEQIEFAGPTAIAFRGNFDYNTDAARGNGLEPEITPKDAKGRPIFPYVTTANDEIIIYALKSADPAKNLSSISFWADTTKPRSAYPGSPSNGAEQSVTITGIDTTNENPPYTLYRMTLDNLQGTPVAENIRSLHFIYYSDPKGGTVLKDPPLEGSEEPIDIEQGRMGDGGHGTFPALVEIDGQKTYTGAIGGDGQYIAGKTDTPNFNDRFQRTLITSVRIALNGISPQPDGGYTHPTETVARVKNYRQYQLRALVVPRNLGLTGFPEPNYSAPGPPTVSGACVGHCNAPIICWDPPATGGPVLEYRVEWDTNQIGTFANAVVVTDPAARSATLPDLGGDPSITWYYRVVAVNENGAAESELYPAKPMNTTKPEAPSRLLATNADDTNANNPAFTDYAVKLDWTTPTRNDGAKSNLSCTGSGCVGDGGSIPDTELIRFRVYRGIKPDFNALTEGVKVLDVGNNPAALLTKPGSNVGWLDSAATSFFAPGTCVTYYYRIQAVDRCWNSGNGSWNSSNDASDSESTITPDSAAPLLQQVMGRAFDSGPGVTASKPLNLGVNGVTSSCPAVVNQNCTINLSWNQVNTNSAGQAIGVDRYRLYRFKKEATELVFVADTAFGSGGYVDIPGQSQINSGVVTYTDDTAPALAASSGQVMYYKYVVAANDCRLGTESDPTYFPSLCAATPTIIQAGAQNGSASGDTPQNAWIMNAGDTITASAPTGVTYVKGQFEILAYPSGAVIDAPAAINGAGPYTYTWVDRQDQQVYMVRITVTTATGCQEVRVKYVQDQQAAGCAFTSITAPVPSETTSGSTATASASHIATNLGTEALKLANRNVKIDWVFPDADHNDMVLSSVVLSSGAASSTINITSPTGPGTVNVTFPANFPDVAVNGTFTVTIRWRYAKKDAPVTASPLTKLCIDYQIASEANVTKKCNLVGQAASTANPTACD
jgi:prepilin-type N-terminal cleavage/methylation domain-containing protein